MVKRYSVSIKNIVILITVMCVGLIILTWDDDGEKTPIENILAYTVIPAQNGINVVGDWVNARIQFVNNINKLEKINENLQARVDQLSYENQILEENRIELERLRALYELDKRYADFPKIGAQVISKEPGNWYDSFVINKGQKDGLKVDMVVLSGNGLVGYIKSVGTSYATVKTIIDDTTNVSANISRSSDMCIVSGDKTLLTDKAFCRVNDIHDDAIIVKGDEIVTSHLGGRYPPGILIGTIISIEDNPHLMTKKAILETAVDFKHIEEVLVINKVWKDYKEEE